MPAVTPRPPSVMATLERASNEVPQVDPDAHTDNGNLPLGTVGPQASLSTSVMYPSGGWHASAWDGWPTDWDLPWMGNNWSGFGYGRQNGDGYMNRVATVGTCIDKNSKQIASFPVYGLTAEGMPTSLPVWARNPEPELYSSWADFVKQLCNAFYGRGEAIVYATAMYAPDYRTGISYPSRFVVLDPTSARVELEGGRRRFYLGDIPLNPAEVCHIRYQTVAGRASGVGPLEWAYRNVVSASALESYAQQIAAYGVNVVLTSPHNLSTIQRDDLKNNWMLARLQGRGAPAVLSGGVTLDQMTMSPKDLALLDIRTFDEQRIAAAFGTPAFLVNLPMADGLTYNNGNDLYLHHWSSALRPDADVIASSLSAWALPGARTMEFNPDRYVQPPLATRATTYQTLHGIIDEATGDRAMTVPEIRAAERMTPTTNRDAALDAATLLTGGSM